MTNIEKWIHSNNYFDDLAVFGLGFFHPGGIKRTLQIAESVSWEGLTVLDVGCGVGTTMKILSSQGANTTGIDQSAYMLRGAELNGNLSSCLSQCRIEDYQYGSNFFDVILFEGVLGFVKEPILAIRSALKRLNPNGIVIISDWEPHTRTADIDTPRDYGFTVYGKTSLKDIASSLEVDVNEICEVIEEDRAEGLSLELSTALRRVQSFFKIDYVRDEHIPLVKKKIEAMSVALSEKVACKSYLAVIPARET